MTQPPAPPETLGGGLLLSAFLPWRSGEISLNIGSLLAFGDQEDQHTHMRGQDRLYQEPWFDECQDLPSIHCLCSSPLGTVHREESPAPDYSTGSLHGYGPTHTQLPEGPSSPTIQERQIACGNRQERATFRMPVSGIQTANCLSSYLLISFTIANLLKINYTCFFPFLFHIAFKSSAVKH